jgi:hypothetical protein
MTALDDVMHIIQGVADNRDIRRSRVDAALEKLMRNILAVGVVALTEEQAVEAYNAGATALDRVLLHIARDADKSAARPG